MTTARAPVAPTDRTDGSAELFVAACGDHLTVDIAGRLPTHLTSVSGLAESRRHEGVIWAVEDSLEPPVVTALDLEGRQLASVRLVGRPLMNLDWEDLAIGPGPDGTPWIHVGDIGDNFGIRPEVQIHRFPEPNLADATVTPDTVSARYEHGRPNAEALVVDAAGDIWVIDKDPTGPATLYLLDPDPPDTDPPDTDRSDRYRPDPDPDRPDNHRGVLRERGTVDHPGEEVTAADLSADGELLALRTHLRLRLHRVPPGGTVADALATTPCATPDLPETQGESVAVLADGGGLVTVSEDESGAPVDLHLTRR